MAVSAQKDEVDEHQIVVVVGFDGLDAAILALQNPAEALGRDPFQGRQHSSLVAQARRRRELAAGASAAGTV